MWTTGLSRIKETTIHGVFEVYNRLFTHFEQSQARLRRKKVPWKQAMLQALNAGREKLSAYYQRTEEVHGHLYAIGTILAPKHKLAFFKGPEWEGDDADWHNVYERSLHRYLEDYSKRQPNTVSLQKGKAPMRIGSSFESLLAKDRPKTPPQPKTGWRDELQSYLNLGAYYLFLLWIILNSYLILETEETNPCQFWRDYEHKFPTLAALARDVFSIPATGAGVERLFSSARDICHYRRGSLNTTTIQDLMMLRCTSKFDIESEVDGIPEESPNQDEIAEADEKREAQLPEYTPEPISEDEDEADEADEDIQEDQEDQEDDDSAEHPLPIVRPQRGRKRRRDADEYDEH
jgi:hypothetical protein